MKKILNILSNFFEEIVLGRKKPKPPMDKITKIFRVNGIDYYRYINIRDLPPLTMIKLIDLLPNLYHNHDKDFIIAALDKIDSIIENGSNTLSIYKVLAEMRNRIRWQISLESVIHIVALLTFEKDEFMYDEAAYKKRVVKFCASEEFIKQIITKSVDLGLNEFLLNPKLFSEFFVAQIHEMERMYNVLGIEPNEIIKNKDKIIQALKSL